MAATASDYHYIRVIEDIYSKKKLHTVTEFYRTGEPYSIGTLTDNHSRKMGEFTYYYKNGHPKININYDGEPTGNYQEWYEDGRDKLEAVYLQKTADPAIVDKLQIRNYWNKNNVHQVINGNGFYQVDLGDVKLSGQLKNGLRDSIWNGSIKSLKAVFKEKYDQGKLVSGHSTVYGGKEYQYEAIEEHAQPVNGFKTFYKFISKNLVFNRNLGQGKIFVRFEIATSGELSTIQVVRDMGYGSGQEVIRVLGLCGPWLPARTRGIPRSTNFTLPITVDRNNIQVHPNPRAGLLYQ